MAMWQDAGIPAADVLRSATLLPAEFCGMGERLGSVQTGKVASLLLLRANPLADIRNVGEIEGVFLRGLHYDRAALDKMLADVKAACAGAEPAGVQGELVLPGRELRRGRYTSKFGQWPSGTESFVIARTDGGYALMARNEPQGGFMTPFQTTAYYDEAFQLQRCTSRQLTRMPTEAEYVVGNGRLEARASKGGEELPPHALPLEDGTLVGDPSTAGTAFLEAALGLEPGEERELRVVGFGYPSWEPYATDYTVRREPDRDLARPDGTTVTARFHTYRFDTPQGAFTFSVWSSEQHVLLKLVMEMPFGTVTTELQ
jgi:hypothetical protein